MARAFALAALILAGLLEAANVPKDCPGGGVATLLDDAMSLLQLTVGTTAQPGMRDADIGMIWPFSRLDRTTSGLDMVSTSSYLLSSTPSDNADNVLHEVDEVVEEADDALDDADDALGEIDDAFDSVGLSAEELGGTVALLQRFADAAGRPPTTTRKVRHSKHDDLSVAAAEAAEMTERAAASLQKFAEFLVPRTTTTRIMPHPEPAIADVAAGDAGTSAGHSGHSTGYAAGDAAGKSAFAKAFGDTVSKEAGPRETSIITTTTNSPTVKLDGRGNRQESGSTASSTTTTTGRRDERGQYIKSGSTITTTIDMLHRHVGQLEAGTTTSSTTTTTGRRDDRRGLRDSTTTTLTSMSALTNSTWKPYVAPYVANSQTETETTSVAARGGEPGSRARHVIDNFCSTANSVAHSAEAAVASLQELASIVCIDFATSSTTPGHRGNADTQHGDSCKSVKDIIRHAGKTSKSFHSFAQTLHPEHTTTTTMPLDPLCAAMSDAAEQAAILSDSLQRCIAAECKEAATTTTTGKKNDKDSAVKKAAIDQGSALRSSGASYEIDAEDSLAFAVEYAAEEAAHAAASLQSFAEDQQIVAADAGQIQGSPGKSSRSGGEEAIPTTTTKKRRPQPAGPESPRLAAEGISGRRRQDIQSLTEESTTTTARSGPFSARRATTVTTTPETITETIKLPLPLQDLQATTKTTTTTIVSRGPRSAFHGMVAEGSEVAAASLHAAPAPSSVERFRQIAAAVAQMARSAARSLSSRSEASSETGRETGPQRNASFAFQAQDAAEKAESAAASLQRFALAVDPLAASAAMIERSDSA